MTWSKRICTGFYFPINFVVEISEFKINLVSFAQKVFENQSSLQLQYLILVLRTLSVWYLILYKINNFKYFTFSKKKKKAALDFFWKFCFVAKTCMHIY